MSETEELLAEAKARLADIALGARMMLEVAKGCHASYAREVLRVATACLEPRCGDEGRLCDECLDRETKKHTYLRGTPRHQVINDEQSRAELAAELRDAGRGHLVV
jgi:hypothetical protein